MHPILAIAVDPYLTTSSSLSTMTLFLQSPFEPKQEFMQSFFCLENLVYPTTSSTGTIVLALWLSHWRVSTVNENFI